MANYNAAGRSNYFAVKDEAAFREWALSLGTDAITPDLCRPTADGVRPFGIAVGNHDGSGAWPTQVSDSKASDFVAIDLPARLTPHLPNAYDDNRETTRCQFGHQHLLP